MPKRTYSLYEAKAKFSAIVRMVREGASVTVTVHGEPVAEIHPVPRTSEGLERRLERFAASGVVVTADKTFRGRVIQRRTGALKRFLAERGE